MHLQKDTFFSHLSFFKQNYLIFSEKLSQTSFHFVHSWIQLSYNLIADVFGGFCLFRFFFQFTTI